MKTAIIKLTSAILSAVLLTGCSSDLIVKVENAEYRNYFSDSRTVSIDLSDDISSADISLGTGSITCINTEFTDSSSMKCGTGHITMRDCTYMADTSVSAETGQLLFGLPTNGSAADIDLSVDTGNMEIWDAKSYEITDGSAKDGEVTLEYKDTTVSASVKTGNISIDKE